MNDDTRRLVNFKPGDDGQLTDADKHKMMDDLYKVAMKAHWEIAADEADQLRQQPKDLEGEDPWAIVRALWLDDVEKTEWGRAVFQVRLALTAPTTPLSEQEVQQQYKRNAENKRLAREIIARSSKPTS